MPRRPPTTVIDYLLVAINPAFIMTLVGSLVFFLLAVFYRGDFENRLWFTFAMFVMATVCIARISIEEGRSRAALFALPMGALTAFAVNQFTNLPILFNLGLLALTWWSSDRLTWDCTVIDDDQDSTGSGLLQVLGWEFDERAANEGDTESTSAPGFLEKWFPTQGTRHTPGVWVIYFSLAALPLFGVGQFFLPSGDVAARNTAFLLLVVYMGSGLALLLTTTFLGLRRYLRQRGVEMPVEMAVTWLATGGAMIGVLLLLSTLLPRPTGQWQLSQYITSLKRDASKFGFGKEGAQGKQDGSKTGKPRDGGKQSDSSQQGQGQQGQGQQGQGQQGQGQQSQSQQGKTEQGDSQQTKSDPGTAEQQSQPQQAQAREPQNDSNARLAESPPPPTPPSAQTPMNFGTLAEMIANFGRLLSYLLLAAIIGYFAWKYRVGLLEAWQQIWQELREFLAKLLGGAKKKPAPITVPTPQSAPPPSFASFTNPFQTGMAQRTSPRDLILYSFRAFEAWARERGCPRTAEQTPLEFAAAVAAQRGSVTREARELAEMYCQIAYARTTMPGDSVQKLQRLWQGMTTTASSV